MSNLRKLVVAAQDGNVEGLREILTTTDVNVNGQLSENGFTALHAAAACGHAACIRVLIAYGADIEIKTTSQFSNSFTTSTPLEQAMKSNQMDSVLVLCAYSERRPDKVDMLLFKGNKTELEGYLKLPEEVLRTLVKEKYPILEDRPSILDIDVSQIEPGTELDTPALLYHPDIGACDIYPDPDIGEDRQYHPPICRTR